MPLEEKSIIGTYSEIVVETQNTKISLNHSFQYEKNIFEPELEGFFFCLSPYPSCLQGSDYQAVEDLYELENHQYVDPN